MKQMQICCTLNDCNLQEREKSLVALLIFYKDFDKLPLESYQEAFEKCLWFVDGVKKKPENREKGPELIDGEQDFPFIVGPVNRVLGKEIQSLKYLHWWSFLSAYTEIGDCTFQKIVSIRSKRAKVCGLKKANANGICGIGKSSISRRNFPMRKMKCSANGRAEHNELIC